MNKAKINPKKGVIIFIFYLIHTLKARINKDNVKIIAIVLIIIIAMLNY